MATITTRSGKGSALTHTELDNNFSNLNSDKVEASGDSITGNLDFQDNAKAQFGNSNDLQIYHDGSNSFISDQGSGSLVLRGSTAINLQNGAGTEYLARFFENGSVNLYYDGSQKLATTSTGIDVTGTVVSNGLTLENNAEYLRVKNSSGSSTRAFGVNSANNLYIGGIDADIGPILFVDNGATLATLGPTGLDVTGTVTADNVDLAATGALESVGTLFIDIDKDNSSTTAALKITADGQAKNIGRFVENGDVSFYEDTGTTAKFFWDASAESLTLGTGLGGTANHPLNVGGEIAVVNNSGANPSDAGSFYWKESGGTWGTDMFGARARYDGSANILKFEFANLTSTGTNLELERDTGDVHIPTGKLGIGTTSPATNLEISDSSGAELRLTNSSTALSQGSLIGALEFYSSDTSGINPSVASSVKAVASTGGGAYGELTFNTIPGATEGADATEAMRINASGNVGIGTNSPAFTLDVNSGTTDYAMRIQSTDSTAYIAYQDNSTSTSTTVFNGAIGDAWAANGGNAIRFLIGLNEKARIDSSGNLLVGKTSGNTLGTPGVEIDGNLNRIMVTRDDQVPMFLNRNSTNGIIQEFRKDNSTVGTIGSSASQPFFAGTSNGFRLASGGVVPSNSSGANADNAYDLGGGPVRWKDLYLSGGISFNPNAAANKLDDYEEGTFDPEVIGTTTAGTATYSTQYGKYTKVGNIVFVQLYVTYTGHTGTGNLRISGLPFTAYSQAGLPIGDISLLTKPADSMFTCSTVFNSTVLRMRTINTASGTGSSDLAMDAAATINVSGVYRID